MFTVALVCSACAAIIVMLTTELSLVGASFFQPRPGTEIYEFPDAFWDAMKATLAPTYDEWVSNLAAKGLPAQQALDDYEQAFKDQ